MTETLAFRDPRLQRLPTISYKVLFRGFSGISPLFPLGPTGKDKHGYCLSYNHRSKMLVGGHSLSLNSLQLVLFWAIDVGGY